MMCYCDMSFCLLSNKKLNRQEVTCDNTKCDRHSCHIPNNLPEWELISYGEFLNCPYYKGLIKDARSI